MFDYDQFTKIDGAHPWRDISPEGYKDYPARYRKGGRVLYFNFELAKELRLIPQKHPHQLTSQLHEIILKTFSMQIINEFDQKYKKRLVKDHFSGQQYMATRYLQVQHKNKQGKTSGDGRSIWNGVIKTKERIFDISSRGTGATSLSPGAQETKKFIATGNQKHGYASGLAELDEMLGSAIMSEIFYKRGIPTERCLTVIDFKNKTSIGVRTAPNLIRPAHMFRYLKSNCWQELKDSFEYFLERQENNGSLKLPKNLLRRYAKALQYLAQVYAKLAAVMEEEYIFNWLSWDGDNMLAHGGILDYGSIRQFAAKHNKYRYEDVDRFSTCLTEQKYWARRTLQTFVQAVDFILSKEKKSIECFKNDSSLKLFDQYFECERQQHLLRKIGFTPEQSKKLLRYHQDKVNDFRKLINYFEDIKTVKGQRQVADGINHPPVFLIRDILRELPCFLQEALASIKSNKKWPVMPVEQFCKIMAASYIEEEDITMTKIRGQKALAFQKVYHSLIKSVGTSVYVIIKNIAKRSAIINYAYRSTGDGLVWVVNETIKVRDQMDRGDIQEVLDRFIESQILIPEKVRPILPEDLKGNSKKARLLRALHKNMQEFYETI